MMGFTASDLRQMFRTPKLLVKRLALFLSRGVLPIRTIRMTESSQAFMHVVTWFQLLLKRLLRVEIIEQCLGLLAPKDGAMLHAGARNAPDPTKVALVVLQPLEHEVHGVEPHAYRGIDLALRGIGEHTLLDAIFLLQVVVE